MDKLPPELFSKILFYALDGYLDDLFDTMESAAEQVQRRKSALYRLLSVSRRWQESVYTTPSLWSAIHIPRYPPNTIVKSLERAGPRTLLDVVINPGIQRRGTDQDFPTNRAFHQCLDAVRRCSNRWRSLVVNTVYVEDQVILESLIPKFQLQNLHHVTLHGIKNDLHFQKLLNLLSTSPNLEYLTLARFWPSVQESQAPIVVPRLRVLTFVRAHPANICAACSLISTPELTTIGVRSLTGKLYRGLEPLLNILSPARFPYLGEIVVETSHLISVVDLLEMTRAGIDAPRNPPLRVHCDKATSLDTGSPLFDEDLGRFREELARCADVEWLD